MLWAGLSGRAPTGSGRKIDEGITKEQRKKDGDETGMKRGYDGDETAVRRLGAKTQLTIETDQGRN
jgi:hypothetical protein